MDATRAVFNGVMLADVRPMLVFPQSLVRGDEVVVVAPSGPPPEDAFWRGLAWLRTRYRVRMSPGVLSRDGYLAGGDSRRRAELERAMLDPSVKAIIAARGGYGAMRILADLPWAEFARRPKWLVGFSDITALHAMAWAAGLASVLGPNVTGLGMVASAATRAAWIAALERPSATRVWRGLRVVHAGQAGQVEGILVGGNLALVYAMAAAGRLTIPKGAVLAVEDVGEAPYRVDRMLTSLRLGGHLGRANALVFGSFEGCAPRGDGRTTDDVIEDVTRPLGVPVLTGAPFGHGAENEAFVMGAPATVRGDELRLF